MRLARAIFGPGPAGKIGIYFCPFACCWLEFSLIAASAAHNETHYIVSELIKGESLRRFIERGLIPIRKYLEIAVQIADALAAVPQGGIVYRDLKPEFRIGKAIDTKWQPAHTHLPERQQCKPCPQSLAK